MNWIDNIVMGIESDLRAEGDGKDIEFFIDLSNKWPRGDTFKRSMRTL
jgi:hypothetical protein